LTQAGYHNAVGLPELTFNIYSQTEDSRNMKTATALQEMWQVIGINVKINMISDYESYTSIIDQGKAGMILRGWTADYIDPDNFLRTLFFSSSPENIGFFADAEFDKYVSEAGTAISPAQRQEKYILAESVLCDKQAGIIPLVNYVKDDTAPAEIQITNTPTSTIIEFEDDFSDPNSGWESYDGANADFGYHEGSTYYMEINKSDYWARSIAPLADFGTISNIAVGFSATTPESLSGEYGIWCNYTDEDNKYEIAISPEGVAYQISKTINGRTTVLTNPSWKVLNNYALTKINEFGVFCADNEIGLFVNDFDEPVEVITDGSITQGGVALYIESASIKENEVFKVLFHEFYAFIP